MRIEEVLKTNKFRDERHKVVLNIFYTSYFLRDQISIYLKEFDMTSEQFNVLRILRGSLPKYLCVKDIAERLIEKNSNVTRILERLQRKELIERIPSEHDRRENVTVITEKGLQLLEILDVEMQGAENELVNITNEDAMLLNQLLDKMRDK
jgi:DNA-binding MarR family transcriptional regulator